MAAVYVRLVTNFRCLLYTYYMLPLVGHTSAFEKWMNITGDRTVGGDAYIICNSISSPGEILHRSEIWPLPFQGNDYFFMIRIDAPYAIVGPKHHRRLSITTNRSGVAEVAYAGLTAVMRITHLQCSDGGEYGCSYDVGSGQTETSNYKISARLVVKTVPDIPMMTMEPNSMPPVRDHMFVYEKSTVTATCSANLGRPVRGHLEWILYVKGIPEYIGRTDSRIQPLEKDYLRSGDANCSERVRQRFLLKMTEMNQKAVIACFIKNPQLSNYDRRHCTDDAANLCVRSPFILSIPRTGRTSMFKRFGIALLAIFLGVILAILAERYLGHYFRTPKPPSPKPILKPPPAPTPPLDEDYEENESFYDEDAYSESMFSAAD